MSSLSEQVFNALTANIAVLDGQGVIVSANDAWNRFAAENGARAGETYVGSNYLAVCEAAGDEACEVSDALRALLRGERDEIAIEYPCDSPRMNRWFLLRASRLAGGGIVVSHTDITVRRNAEEALRGTERVLRSVLETLPVGIWIMDRNGRIIHGNPAGQRIWAGARYVGPEQFGEYKGWWRNTGQLISADEWAAARAIRNGETSIDEEIDIECFDGTRKVILNSAIPLRDPSGAVAGAIIVNQDITARKEGEEELRRATTELQLALSRERVLARTDPLTGAANRRHFYDLATQELAVARRYRQPLSMILFDVDHFKRINDTFGHDAGDETLKRIAAIAREHLREADIFARYGGEEFIILLPQTGGAEARVVAERLREDIAASGMVLERGVLKVTISGGVAEVESAQDTLEGVIHRADEALYRAKQNGRNRTVSASL